MCVSVQNLTNFCPHALISNPNVPKNLFAFRIQTFRKFCSHSKIPIRCLWTAFCVPLSFIFYEKQLFRMGNRHASPQSFAALWQINNWRNPFSRRSSLPRGQPENVVHSGMQRSRFKLRAGNKIFFSFLLFAINKAYF